MTNIHSNPTPLRQKFIEYLTLNRKAERTVHCYVSFIYSLAKHCRRSPDLLGTSLYAACQVGGLAVRGPTARVTETTQNI